MSKDMDREESCCSTGPMQIAIQHEVGECEKHVSYANEEDETKA